MDSVILSNYISGGIESRIGGRTENQDHYEMAETPVGPLIVVCDGMGGGPSGKTASSVAAKRIVSAMQAVVPGENPGKALSDAIIAANNAVNEIIADNPSMNGMGTTCVCILIYGKTAYIAHEGDSRCYIIRNDKVKFRTADHSQVAELVRQGLLTEEQARLSAYSNIITRGIGIHPKVEPEIDVVSLKKGDRIALMTDGIWGTMTESILIAELTSSTPEAVASRLPERIDARGHRKGGGHDNMTLAVVDVMDVPKRRKVPGCAQASQLTESTNDTYSAGSKRKPIKAIIGVCIGMGAGAVIALIGMGFFTNKPASNVSALKDSVAPSIEIEPALNSTENESAHTSTSKSDNAPVAPVTSVQTVTGEQLINDANTALQLDNICSKLAELRDYCPPKSPYNKNNKIGKAKKAKKARIKARDAIIDEILSLLENFQSADPQDQEKCARVRQLIIDNRKDLRNIDDNYGKTVRTAKEKLEQYIHILKNG